MTIKQKKLAKTLGKSRSLKQAMLAAGYAESTANQQTTITQTTGFKEILEKYGPTLEDAFQATKDGLVANKVILSPTEPDREYADHQTRLKAAEQTYKLHQVYNDTDASIGGDVNITINVTEPSSQLIGTSGTENMESSS